MGPHPSDPSLWEWINTNGSGIGAVAGVVAAIVAVLALWSAAADTRARSQPMIAAEFRPAVDSNSTIDLVISNLGPTPARELVVTFDPPLELPDDTSQLVTPFLVKRYRNPIPVLNPGQELLNIWWAGMLAAERTGLINSEPTPDQVTVNVSYKGRRLRRIHDSYQLNTETVRMTTYSVSSDSPRGRLKTIDESLKAIKSSLAEIAKFVGRAR